MSLVPLIQMLAQLYHHIQDPNQQQRNDFSQALVNNPNAINNLNQSGIADNPQLLAQMMGGNARWGANSNAATNLANTITSAPVDDLTKAKKTEQVQNTPLQDIANASQSLPQFRAFNGMSNTGFNQNVLPAYQNLGTNPGMASNTPGSVPNNNGVTSQTPDNKPQLLSQGQQDLLSKSRGLETSFEKSTRIIDESVKQQQVKTSAAVAASEGANTQRTQQEIAANQPAIDADKLIDQYYASNPAAKSRSALDIFQDPTVSGDVKNALMASNKTKGALSSQMGAYFEKARNDIAQSELGISKQRLGIEQTNATTQQGMLALDQKKFEDIKTYRAMETWAKNGFQGPLKGYKDIYDGNATPEAQIVNNIMQSGPPKEKMARVAEYNKVFNGIQAQINSKTGKQPLIPELQPSVEQLNILGRDLTARGIPTPELKYDYVPDSRKSGGQNFTGMFQSKSHLPKALVTITGAPADTISTKPSGPIANNTDTQTQPAKKALTTISGGVATPPSYSIHKDSTVLQTKANKYQEIQTRNPKLPPAAIQALVESWYKEQEKK